MQMQTFNHSDPITLVLVVVTSLYFYVIVGRYVAKRINHPGVFGERLIGVVIGNLFYFSGLSLFLILRKGSSIFEIAQKLLQEEVALVFAAMGRTLGVMSDQLFSAIVLITPPLLKARFK